MSRKPLAWDALDKIREACKVHSTDRWNQELELRRTKAPRNIPSDREMVRHFCIAIAYSQGAQSKQVSALLAKEAFGQSLANFDVQALAATNPKEILSQFWPQLGCIRFPSKVASMVRCAQVLLEIAAKYKSFARYLSSFEIPQRIRSNSDLQRFWHQFDILQVDLRSRDMPFFRSTTSLLQLLLDLDFDSVKPDLIVMRFARRIGLVEKETGERSLRAVARQVQDYAWQNGLRASEVDLAMLGFGGQTGAAALLTQKFCPSHDPCRNKSCPVGADGLCMAYTG